MNPSEIFEYVTEGTKWLAIGAGAYPVILMALNSGSDIFSQKIKSQEELDRIVEEEAGKLGMDKPVRGVLHDSWEGQAKKNPNGKYQIDVGWAGACKSTVRHELYHIHKGDCDGPLSKLYYFFVAEPRAVAYAIFRLRL